jgi:demethylmenaquinone methyltransferase/2-methoxy-6-polyprenyl-1,4-benzoquinol methylase
MPNYAALSIIYDMLDVVYFRHYKSSPRTALLNVIPDTSVRVLDVCAGTCSNSILIAQNKPKASVVALDSSPEMLKLAKKKICKHNIHNVEMVVADACNTGFAAQSFDVILLSLILHEVNEDLRMGIINKAKRLLQDNGSIIVIEWEQPHKLSQRFLFTPLKLFEPRGFKAFLRMDLMQYFGSFGLEVAESWKCDYTRVYKLIRKVNT